MSKDARRKSTKSTTTTRKVDPVVEETTVVTETTKATEASTAEELRQKAEVIRKEADEKIATLIKEAEEYEAAEKAAKEREAAEKARKEAEAKERERIERAARHQRVYFTHNVDGSIDFDHPFMNPLDAKHFDPEYVCIPSLVEKGKYIRPLEKKDLD